MPSVAVLLFALRFLAPSLTASLGVQGWDTSGLDAFFGVYDAALPVMAALLATLLITTWPGGFDPGVWTFAAVFLAGCVVVFWAGEADPGLRLVQGPWAPLALGTAVTGAIVAHGHGLEGCTGGTAQATEARRGLRGVYVGFALAYLLGCLRFVDFQVGLGVTLPSGLLWFLAYGPTLVLCALSVIFWTLWTREESVTLGNLARRGALPVLGALLGLAVSHGLGGFILSSTLTWGGAYEVFVPTWLSLATVGFAAGAFLSTAWFLRGSVSASSWGFIFGGVSVAALGGIGFFGGALGSLAGILLGLTCIARGLAASGNTPSQIVAGTVSP